MISLTYSIIAFLALPFALLYHLFRSVSRGRPPAFAERLGSLSPEVRKLIEADELVWVHAVSVGEVIAARPLLRELRKNLPDCRILLSVTTETGRAVADGDSLADAVIFFPFDILPAVRRLLCAASPRLIVIMETEIWPVFISESKRTGIPVVLVNGRISDRSFPRYLRFGWFFRPVLNMFSFLGMQSDEDRNRMLAIGGPVERTITVGNLKYDIPSGAVGGLEVATIKDSFGIPGDALVITAGSTHPGEEELLVAIYRELLSGFSNLCLVLVPRHPERSGNIEEMLLASGFHTVRRSALKSGDKCPPGSVLLVDTVGDLMKLYSLSDIAYVGGSLVPNGGHNLLEPASLGIPSIFGPRMENFREVASLVLRYGAGLQVENAEELAERCRLLLKNKERRKEIGANGLRLMNDCGGATGRYMEILLRFMKR